MASSSAETIGIILPLGLDTFGVSLALGVAGFSARLRLRLSFLFAAFEAAMPLIGVALGAPLGRSIGGVADYFAAGLIAALGVYLLVAGGDDDEGERLLAMTQRGMVGALALGVSISLDELAIGFSAGLLRLPILAMVIAIGLQAFVVTQIGVRLGSRVGTQVREATEKIAGIALLGLGGWLLIQRLAA